MISFSDENLTPTAVLAAPGRASLAEGLVTFGSRLLREKGPGDYVSREAFDNYLATNPHNESRFLYPISEDSWQDPETDELVAEDASVVELRDRL